MLRNLQLHCQAQQGLSYASSGASQVVLVAKKTLPTNAGDVRNKSWIPGLGKSPEEGHGNPL